MKSMTPSKTTTAGQIDKAVANYRALLEKHSGDFNAETVQTALGQPGLAEEQFAVFRRRVEVISNLIVRKAKVNRGRSQQEAIEATGRAQFTDRKVVDSMPKGEGDEVEVLFFKPEPWEYTLPGWMSDEDLEKSFDRRALNPADPISVAAVNEDDSAFADEKPHGTHWKDTSGKWCYAAFLRWSGKREVLVDRNDDVWYDHWWFAGLRK